MGFKATQFLALLSLGLILGCAAESLDSESTEGPFDMDAECIDVLGDTALFNGTLPIDIQFPQRCGMVSVRGEELLLRWTPTEENRVYVAVFKSYPIVADKIDPSRLLWVWTTGGSRIDNGRLFWTEGYLPDERGFPDLNQPAPRTLEPGIYWLALWAWDDARQLVASAAPRVFIVTDETPEEQTFFCNELNEYSSGIAGWCIPDDSINDSAAEQTTCFEIACPSGK